MAANYVLLEKITVGAATASSVTFSSIPQTGYTDLVVKMSTRTSASTITGRAYVAFNGVSTNQTRRLLLGNGSSASSGSANDIATDRGTGNSATASTFANMEMYIPDYTSSNFKSVSIDAVGENNATEAYAGLIAGLWSSTAAINQITLSSSDGGDWMQGSTFYLYGVAKLGTTPAIVPYATGGDIIDTDGTYWYHAFLSSGTFTPAKGISCDVLVVAGGGGGGSQYGGGAGAGGVAYQTSRSVSSATTVTIGAGGTSTISSNGTNGGNSVFDTITANGGGGGGAWNSSTPGNGVAGGSGGGGAMGSSVNSSTTGGAATQGSSGGATGYGFAGGGGQRQVTPGSNFVGGGGGGAGAVGALGLSTGNGGAGGAGLNTWSSWLSVTGLGVSGFIAGGGGGSTGIQGGGSAGGAGGAGGGSAGGYGGAAITNAIANTGGGGGGNYEATAATGGSGLVIVRYAV